MKCPRLVRAFFALSVTTASVASALGAWPASLSAAASDDRETTAALLKEIDASPKKALVAELVTRSRSASDRAAKLREKGDEPHARLADGLAKTWAEAARDTLRAVAAEERGLGAQRDAVDAGAQADRERALLEEAMAQVGRLKAQLEPLEKPSKEAPARTSKAANDETKDAAAPKASSAKKDGKTPKKNASDKDGGAP